MPPYDVICPKLRQDTGNHMIRRFLFKVRGSAQGRHVMQTDRSLLFCRIQPVGPCARDSGSREPF